ncbi:MAPEG family protein [Rhodopseudomonas palustris]|uniref:MAPEG family protein n=1 Tax=Rhodopseudomonas palustris TaxID=1076 RepID=A0A418VF19_RHOPL|nr:MAPEG family protein [Rhodopseudomonas palustris]RJF74712.1 MAPEG family protein [Rhodopseudomonas palustris]
MFHYTTIATLLAVMFYFYTTLQVSRARGVYDVKAPATTGNPDFERVFRVQANTLEWMPIFLPSLWLFAYYLSDAFAALLGAVWIIGRIMYLVGYAQAAGKRGAGFAVQMVAAAGLWGGAVYGVVHRMLGA